jgi:hypothetical protein
MNYQKAKDIRGKKFSELMTDKLVAGDGIVSSFAKTISERSKARSTGLKEKFDPLNIAKVLTGGSRLGPALLGKMTGASKERMSYFAGDPKKKKIEALASGIKPESLEMATTSLGNIYELLKKDKEEKKLQRELSYSKEEEQEFEEDRRNQELIKALTARVKPRKKKKVEEKKAEEPEKPKEPEKPMPTVKGKGKAPTKTTEKPTAPEAPKPTAPPATKPTVPTAPKPTATPTPKAPTLTVPTAAKIAVGAAGAAIPLGALSAKFESSKAGPAAIGYDSTGGTSYGTYQLASKVGVVKEFLGYLSNVKPEWAQQLLSAGDPNTGSTKGQFPDTWKKIAAENSKEFDKIQHDFIEMKHYNPTVKSLGKIGYDVQSQPAAIKDVVWSTAVQHGSGGAVSIFKKAIEQSGGVNAKPEDIIKSVYEIRRTKFGSSTESVRASVNKRFDVESKMALEMLNTSGTQIDSSSKENKDLKNSLNKDKPKQTVVNNTTVNSEMQSVNPSTENVVDDRPAIIKKRDS